MCIGMQTTFYCFISSSPSRMQHQACSILEVEIVLYEAFEGQDHMLLQIPCWLDMLRAGLNYMRDAKKGLHSSLGVSVFIFFVFFT